MRRLVWMFILFMLLQCAPALAITESVDIGNPPMSQHMSYATYYTTASCQRDGLSGVRTANGEVYDEHAFTAARPSHTFGGRYRVCRVGTTRCVVVRHNDYGPGQRGRQRGVVVDVTPAAFRQLGELREGVIPVEVRRLND